ncbi:hypothetical protein PMAYCL1PPCAC_32380, partial [Pristionchus mayeri]
MGQTVVVLEGGELGGDGVAVRVEFGDDGGRSASLDLLDLNLDGGGVLAGDEDLGDLAGGSLSFGGKRRDASLDLLRVGLGELNELGELSELVGVGHCVVF